MKFHAEICTHCWNINISHRGLLFRFTLKVQLCCAPRWTLHVCYLCTRYSHTDCVSWFCVCNLQTMANVYIYVVHENHVVHSYVYSQRALNDKLILPSPAVWVNSRLLPLRAAHCTALHVRSLNHSLCCAPRYRTDSSSVTDRQTDGHTQYTRRRCLSVLNI